MKNLLLSVCLLSVSAPVLAETSDIVASNNQFGVQSRATRVAYTETGNGIFGTQTGILDTETGTVPGIGLAVSSMSGPDHAYVHAEFDLAHGHTTYTGALLTGGTYGSFVGTSSATLTDFSGRFGQGFALQDAFMLTPYTELGRHHWDRGVNYGEAYTHYYLGLGALGQYSPIGQVVLSADVMIARTFGSYITVNSGPGLTGFAGPLGDSVLSRVGVAADYAFDRQVHASVGVDFTSFKYGMSAVYPVGGGFVAWEPDSSTKYRTFKLGLGFAF